MFRAVLIVVLNILIVYLLCLLKPWLDRKETQWIANRYRRVLLSRLALWGFVYLTFGVILSTPFWTRIKGGEELLPVVTWFLPIYIFFPVVGAVVAYVNSCRNFEEARGSMVSIDDNFPSTSSKVMLFGGFVLLLLFRGLHWLFEKIGINTSIILVVGGVGLAAMVLAFPYSFGYSFLLFFRIGRYERAKGKISITVGEGQEEENEKDEGKIDADGARISNLGNRRGS